MASIIKNCELCGNSVFLDQEFYHLARRCHVRLRRDVGPAYATLMVHHGEMAAHYVKETDVYDEGMAFIAELSRQYAIREATEAWHYALLLDDKTVARELEARAAEADALARPDTLEVEF